MFSELNLYIQIFKTNTPFDKHRYFPHLWMICLGLRMFLKTCLEHKFGHFEIPVLACHRFTWYLSLDQQIPLNYLRCNRKTTFLTFNCPFRWSRLTGHFPLVSLGTEKAFLSIWGVAWTTFLVMCSTWPIPYIRDST